MLPPLVLGSMFYSFVDDGIANFLGLETLRHGTNISNNMRIRIFGGNPAKGADGTGSTKNFVVDDTRNFFYLFKDSELCMQGTSLEHEIPRIIRLVDKIVRFFRLQRLVIRAQPLLHSGLSGHNYLRSFHEKEWDNKLVEHLFKQACRIVGIFNVICSPILRFRFAKIDSERLQNDPQYNGGAYRTRQLVESWRLGITGSLLTGVNLDWFGRVRAKPLKVLTGVVQLTSAAAIGVLFTPMFTAAPHLVALGAVLA